MMLVVLGGAWTALNVAWSVWMQRRVERLEAADMEREVAENSTVVLRPKSLRPVPWEDVG